jgi:hypothetical protein
MEKSMEDLKRMGEQLEKMGENLWKNKLVGYFLLFWAATFFFSAISSIIWLAEGYGSGLDLIIDGLWSLSELGCAAILALIGLRILGIKILSSQ